MPANNSNRPLIPLQKPFVRDAEVQAAVEALRRGGLMGNEAASRNAERQLSELTGSKHAFLTASCTQALELRVCAREVLAHRQGWLARKQCRDVHAHTFTLGININRVTHDNIWNTITF